jgi:glycerophosphoryl diester phosphodiesterase
LARRLLVIVGVRSRQITAAAIAMVALLAVGEAGAVQSASASESSGRIRRGMAAREKSPYFVRTRGGHRRRADLNIRTRLGAVFLLATLPSGPARPLSPSRGARQYLAHRGGNSGPECTIETYQVARSLGVDLEGDLQRTADGFIVFSHDPSGARMTGQRKLIAESSLSEVQSWDAGWGWTRDGVQRPFAGRGIRIPTLHLALEAFPDVRWNLDIKGEHARMVEDTIKVIRDHRAEDRVTLASFDWATMFEVRARGFAGATALSIPELYATLFPWLFRALPMTGNVAQFPLGIGSTWDLGGIVRRCHACGLLVHFWDVNTIEQARMLIDLEVDILESDSPEVLQSLWR